MTVNFIINFLQSLKVKFLLHCIEIVRIGNALQCLARCVDYEPFGIQTCDHTVGDYSLT